MLVFYFGFTYNMFHASPLEEFDTVKVKKIFIRERDFIYLILKPCMYTYILVWLDFDCIDLFVC